jgi:YYY domain-containing protein
MSGGTFMGSDLFLLIIWWSYILVIGLIFLPLSNKFFSNWFDKGYLLSKAIGIVVLSYISWLLSSSRVLPFRRGVLFGIIIFTVLMFFYIFRNNFKLKEFLISNRRVFIAEEIMFFIIIVFWAYVRGMQPDILGLEKYMDFGFVNCILRADYMPARDMWYAGQNINYYYFGHYVCAFLAKLTGIDSAVAYNLMLCTICSFMFGLTFSISGNLVYHIDKKNYSKIIAAGLISASLLTFGGNLHGFIYGVALPKAKALGIYSGQKTNFYYPDSTRYIGYNPPTNDKTIHEFPIYSLVVSDLHGHVSNVPFVLTFIAFLFSFIANKSNQKLDKYYGMFAVFLLGIFYMTNSWDFLFILEQQALRCCINISLYIIWVLKKAYPVLF